jgi:hypothetical protein
VSLFYFAHVVVAVLIMGIKCKNEKILDNRFSDLSEKKRKGQKEAISFIKIKLCDLRLGSMKEFW